MTLDIFLNTLEQSPKTLDFADTMTVIDTNYIFTPCAFSNGQQQNEAGQNSGSCKLFAFAKLHKLDQQQTLHCFGQYYQDVLNTPTGEDHQNIRSFMMTGWQGISFNEAPLKNIG